MSRGEEAALLEERFKQAACALECRLPLLERVLAVRVRSWLSKLREATSNPAWLRNRNAYARLLLEQLRAGVLEAPFTTQPPQGPLPSLPAYLTYRFLPSPTRGLSTLACAAGSPPSVLPALSPWRGSPPRMGVLPGDRGQDAASTSAPARGGVRSAGPRSGSQRAQAAASACPPRPARPAPASPSAAGLLDAAAALADELEAGRGEVGLLSTRLQYAEERLLQQHAELAQLQGQAARTRRSIRAATVAALDELLQRHGGDCSGDGSGSGCNVACEPPAPLSMRQPGARSSLPADRSAITAAAAGEGELVQQLGRLLSTLRDGCAQLATDMEGHRQAATAAAAGVGASAAAVAVGAAAALRPLLRLSKRVAGREARRLAAFAQGVAQATSLALADAESGHRRSAMQRCMGNNNSNSNSSKQQCSNSSSCSSSGSSDSSGSSSTSDSCCDLGCESNRGRAATNTRTVRKERALLRVQAVQQRARASRVAALQRMLGELQLLGARLREQLALARSRLEAVGGTDAPQCGGTCAAREQGVAAAAVAGAAAAVRAAAEASQASVRELKRQVRALQQAAMAGQAIPPPGWQPAATAAMPVSCVALQASPSAGTSNSPTSPAQSPLAAAPLPQSSDAALAGTLGAGSISRAAAQVATATVSLFAGGALPVPGLPGTRVSAARAAREAVPGRLACLSRQASAASARASVLLAGSMAPPGMLLNWPPETNWSSFGTGGDACGIKPSCGSGGVGAKNIADVSAKLHALSQRWAAAGGTAAARGV